MIDPKRLADLIAHFHKRSEEAYTYAEAFEDRESRRLMTIIAEHYERLALQLETAKLTDDA